MYLKSDRGALRLWGTGVAALAAGFLFAAPAGADTVHPKDDAYVDLKADLLTKKFGKSQTLLIRSSSKGTQVFLRFDMSNLPMGTIIEQGLLRLYVASVATVGNIEVHLVDENWSEKSIKGSNRPTLTTLLTTIAVAKSNKRNFITIDLTAEVQDWLTVPADNFGIVLLSRLPLETGTTLFLGGAGVPSIRARARLGERTVTFLASHPVPPIGARRAALRDEQLAAIAATAATIPGPLVVLGDLNCTHFSSRFKDLLTVGGLEDSASGRGFQPTWPAPWLPLMLPIDHCLLRGDVAVRRRRTRAACGSDHLSLVIDLVLVDG